MKWPPLRRAGAALSLRTQLYVWLLVPMLVLMLASSGLAWHNALEVANSVTDGMLLGSARMIGGNVASEDGRLRSELPPAALENLDTGFGDRVYYRVDAVEEGLLSGFSDFPVYGPGLRPEQWVSLQTHFRGEAVRAIVFAQPVYPFAPSSLVVVQVATTLEARHSMLLRLWLRSVWPQALLLAAAALLGWLWVRAALAPVTRISDAVRERGPASAERMSLADAPREMWPLVQAINAYIDRISQHVSERDRFISNAAHQLKTPITVLNTQITVGLRSPELAAAHKALGAAYETVQRCSRLIHQLLTLSSTDSELLTRIAPSRVALGDLAREVLVDLAELAHQKGIDLGLSADEAPGQVQGIPLLLRELIANLVDNAIRYTPEGGTVTVSIGGEGGRVWLEVEDSGPGIAPAEREQVFERFYRIAETANQEGSGLGLAIVREIALSCQAKVLLSSRPDGASGLRARVLFSQGAGAASGPRVSFDPSPGTDPP